MLRPVSTVPTPSPPTSTPTHQPPPVRSLPVDLWAHIATYSTVQEHIAMTQTCRQVRSGTLQCIASAPYADFIHYIPAGSTACVSLLLNQAQPTPTFIVMDYLGTKTLPLAQCLIRYVGVELFVSRISRAAKRCRNMEIFSAGREQIVYRELGILRISDGFASAARNSHRHILELFMREPFSSTISRCWSAGHAIVEAAEKGDLHMVAFLLQEHFVRSQGFARCLNLPLSLSAAASSGHRNVMELLLQTPPFLDRLSEADFGSACREAARTGHQNVIELLLQPAWVDQLDPAHLQMARDDASTRGHRAIVAMLDRALAARSLPPPQSG